MSHRDAPGAPSARVGRAGGLAAQVARGRAVGGGPLSLPEAVLQQRWEAHPFAARCAVMARPRTGERGEREGHTARASLRVLFPGRRNGGAGPDFLEALLLTGEGRILRGDVEVHRRPSDWWRHGHHRDPAYRRVLLHVVGREESVPNLGVGATPGAEPPFIYALPEDGVWPGDGPSGLGEESPPAAALPCEGLVRRIGAPPVAARLRALGQGRLMEKRNRVARALAAGADPDDLALRHLLIALGQDGNGAALAVIAEGLCLQALPLLAGVEAIQRALRARLPEDLESRTACGGPSAPARRLASARRVAVRPANRLENRLRAAALLLHRHAHEESQDGLAAHLGALASQPVATAVAALRVPPWLGSERALQILVDVAFPLALAQTETVPPSLIARWLDLPGATYRRAEALRGRLAADALPLRRNGDTQALLALERAYCRHGACAICPLARLERGAAGGVGVRAGRADGAYPAGWKGTGPEAEKMSKSIGVTALCRW